MGYEVQVSVAKECAHFVHGSGRHAVVVEGYVYACVKVGERVQKCSVKVEHYGGVMFFSHNRFYFSGAKIRISIKRETNEAHGT